MKTLFFTFLFIASSFSTSVLQETEKMTATFEVYENGIYYFIDTDGFSNEFQYISEEATAAFDLTTDTYVGKTFEITYETSTETDEDNEEFSVSTIVSLKLK